MSGWTEALDGLDVTTLAPRGAEGAAGGYATPAEALAAAGGVPSSAPDTPLLIAVNDPDRSTDSAPAVAAVRAAVPDRALRIVVATGTHTHDDTRRRRHEEPLLAAAGVVLGPERDEAATEGEAMVAVSYLLDLGAEIDVVDREGDTVMHAAAYKQSPRLVGLLAERGADIDVWNRKNKRGWTPLLIAQGFRYGNFKPSAETIAALSEVMRAAGVEPPPAPPRPAPRLRPRR